jgi:putative hydrolase of HD superfamily
MMENDRVARQLAFLAEADRLKSVLRRSLITDGSRQENSAEHSWHLALLAVVLAEYAEPGVDLNRVIRLVVLHDLVEIDAGDTFAYDVAGQAGRVAREERAAARLYGLLPADQAEECIVLWREFEAGLTPEAHFANALDRLQPVLQNLHTAGGTWRLHGVTLEQVLQRVEPVRTAAPTLWPAVERLLHDAVAAGLLASQVQ